MEQIKSADMSIVAKEIVKLLAIHEVPFSMIDMAFSHAKLIAENNSFVSKATLDPDLKK